MENQRYIVRESIEVSLYSRMSRPCIILSTAGHVTDTKTALLHNLRGQKTLRQSDILLGEQNSLRLSQITCRPYCM